MGAWEGGLHSVGRESDSLNKAIVLPCVEQMGFSKVKRSVNQDFVGRVTINWGASWVSEPFPLSIECMSGFAKAKESLCWIIVVSSKCVLNNFLETERTFRKFKQSPYISEQGFGPTSQIPDSLN